MRNFILTCSVMTTVFAGNVNGLTPKDLTPAERSKYEVIQSNPHAAENFLATREYVRQAAAIVAHPDNKKLALELKRPKNFDERYLLNGDAKTLNAAVDLSLNALAEVLVADAPCSTPTAAVPANTPPLAVSDLNTTELARYELIKPNPLFAESFLATRGYVRKSLSIIANPQDKKQALELKRPKSFDTRFLFTGEVDKLNAAVEISLDALAESLFGCDAPTTPN